METARQTALNLLIKAEKGQAYSNLALNAALSQSQLSAQDRSLVTALFYGVLERKITLDYVIQQYSNLKLNKISFDILSVLRMGVYQLAFMDAIPDSAAVNESVMLAEYCRKKSAKGFVNAVLRSFVRDHNQIAYPDSSNLSFCYSVRYSCPEWLVEKWISEYGAEQTEQILAHSLGRPPVTVRVNTLKVTSEVLLQRLRDEKVTARLHPTVQNCITIEKSGDIEGLLSYQQGLFYVQDIASQLCCLALAPQKGERILDLCAAPGGKSFTTALLMENSGTIESFDLYPKRTHLIETGAKRLGISNMKVRTANANQFLPELIGADRVLCDLPCAGLGVIRRKPEIKYKQPEDLKRLPEIQYSILQNASRYLKCGGVLLYSTCSLSIEENEKVAERFLEENKNYRLMPISDTGYPEIDGKGMVTLFPDKNGSDGFFFARFQRISS